MVTDQETGGRGNEKLPLAGSLRHGAGPGHSDCGDLPDRLPSVSCGISVDCLRLRLYAQVKEGGGYEDRRCQIPEVSQRDSQADFQDEGITEGVLLIQ
jgi:hypothetical protein